MNADVENQHMLQSRGGAGKQMGLGGSGVAAGIRPSARPA